MKVRFLGQYITEREEKVLSTTYKTHDTYKWEVFHECEMDRELREGNYININGETKIEKVVYELDGSITYKTTRILHKISC